MIPGIIVEKLDGEAYLPYRASSMAAAYDLTSMEDRVLEPGERHLFPTGLKVAIPRNMAGLILPRSGLALRKGLTVLNSPGLIDSDYRGEVGVLLINHGAEPVEVARGERIAQLMIVSVMDVLYILGTPEATQRGEGGWGSTGN